LQFFRLSCAFYYSQDRFFAIKSFIYPPQPHTHAHTQKAQYKLAGTALANGPQSYMTIHALYLKSTT